jgi:hypothetical protein
MLGNYPNVMIPQYLQAMASQSQKYQRDALDRIARAMKMTVSRSTPKKNLKLIRTSLLLLVKYKTNAKNGNYTFTANLEKLVKIFIERGYDVTEEER